MLVLSRKKSEIVVIDDRIKVMIVQVRGDKVRLGIDAPPGVAIHRHEIWEAIKAESENTVLGGVSVEQGTA